MPRVPAAVREQVRTRANGCCEYCHLPDSVGGFPFHLEHIIARKHRGSSDLVNLAWACMLCNSAKGSDIASLDHATGRLVRLFNPRTHDWDRHFKIEAGLVVGKTVTGRVTVELLQMNSDEQIEVRLALAEGD